MGISIYNKGIKNTNPETHATLNQVYNYITSNEPKEATIGLRDIEQSDWAKDFKAKNFKFATFSGSFTKRNEGSLTAFSGLICIDIDEVTNIKDAKQSIIKDRDLQPALVFTSPSGNGIKAVYKVDTQLDISTFPSAYDHIAKAVEKKFNVTADRLPKSVVSACFLPWDEKAYLNEAAALVSLPKFNVTAKKNSSVATSSLQPDDEAYERAEALVAYLEDNHTNIAESYEAWRNIGFALAQFGESGRTLFHRVSKQSAKYDLAENDMQFDSCMNGGIGDITLGTFYHMVGEAGVPSGEVLKKFNKLSIITTNPEEFWSKEKQDIHTERVALLIKEEGHPLVQWVMNQYSITHEQLCEFNIGLGQYSFLNGNIADVLFAPHQYGVRVYHLNQDELLYEDTRGSHVIDSLFGTEHTANKSTAYITDNPFKAIALSKDPKVDTVCTLFYNGQQLSEKQAYTLGELGIYWKKVYLFKGADYGNEERETREYARSFADALDRDTQVWWVNPVNSGLNKDTQPIEILAYVSSNGKSLRNNAEYVWNTWTKEYKYWLIGGIKRPKLEIDHERLPKVLSKIGVCKHYFSDDTPTLVRSDDNILDHAYNHVLVDDIRENINDNLSTYIDRSSEETGSKLIPRKRLVQVYNKNSSLFLNDDLKAVFRRTPVNLVEETKDMAYLYYQNGVIRIAANNIDQIPYSDLDGKIWKSQILDRDFEPIKGQKKGEFEQFVENVCGKDPNRKKAFMSCLGYHIHSYKDVGNARALILVDEFSSKGVHAGGTGKGIFAKSIRYIRKQGYIAGKTVKTDSQFLFMNVELSDQSFHFEDVKADFDFEVLFNAITDDFQVESKGVDRFTIPFSQSPKIIISTNHTIRGKGNSFDRRQVVLPFSDYYGPHLNPQIEFAHNLFDDWSQKEWRLYDDFMISCIQLYLKEGLIIPKTGQFKVRTFVESTSKLFYDWAEKWLEKGKEYDLRSLFRGEIEMLDNTLKVDSAFDSTGQIIPAFCKAHPNELDLAQAKTFNSWILEYGEYKNWKIIKRDSNGAVLLKFS